MPRKPRGKRQITPDGRVQVAAKNANGTGSIYPVVRTRITSGKAVETTVYKASFTDPATGKRRTVTGATKAEAAERRAAKLEELSKQSPTGRLGDHPTVADVAAYWLEITEAEGKVSPDTLHKYRKDVVRIVDHLGHLRIERLDEDVVRDFLVALRSPRTDDDGTILAALAESTVDGPRTRLGQIAKLAVKLHHLPTNPVAEVPVPKARVEEQHTQRILTPTEMRDLLAVLDGANRYDASVGLLLTVGLRVSETLGLAWSDVDFDAATIHVQRACTYTGGGVGARLHKPKTTRTAGVHHLAPTAVQLLRQRRKAQAAEKLAAGGAWGTITYKGEQIDLVFTNAQGGYPLRQHVTRALQAACERAGVDPAKVATHTGRRSVVTNLFTSGVPTEDIARHVGHARTSTTEGYVHDLGNRPEVTARKAAELFDPAANTGS